MNKIEASKIKNIVVDSVIDNAKFVLVILLIPVILTVFVKMFIPASMIFSTGDDISSNKNDIQISTQKHFYDNIGKDERQKIIDIICETYHLSITESDIYNVENNGFRVLNTTCDLTICYLPSSSKMVNCISAYVNAVDSVIIENGGKNSADFEEIMSLTDITTLDEQGNIGIKEWVIKKYIRSDSMIDEYDLFLSRNNVFKLDYENPKRWDCSIEIKENWVVDKPGSSTFEQIVVNGAVGTIDIYIYYDLSQYRIGELKTVETNMYTKDSLITCSAEKAEQLIASKLYQNYETYFALTGETDNRTQLFSKLFNNGYLMCVPISGLNSEYLCMETGETAMIDNVVNGSRDEIWNTIGKLRNNGTLSLNATRYNCTEFANYWFYRLYGEGYVLNGDGNQMVDCLMATEYGQQHFRKSYSPAAGAIFSISSLKGEGGHVGCVDGVDFENQTITISHGNTDGDGAIRLRETMTFSQFAEMVNNFGDGSTVMFAVPVQESFKDEKCLYAQWLMTNVS